MPSFDLSSFKKEINKRGVLKHSRYEVQIGIPTYLQSRWANYGDMLSFRCEALRLPGMQFASADGPPRLGYGPLERHPYNVNYEEISLTFIMDARTEIHKFFYDWSNSIFNFKGKGGMAAQEGGGPSAINNALVYEVGYKEKYSVDMDINVYKDTGALTMSAKLYKAFPMAMPAIPMAWGDSEIVKLTVPFTYLDFDITYNAHAEDGDASTEK